MSRHPIIPTEIAQLENKADGLTEAEAEEEFDLLEFNQKRLKRPKSLLEFNQKRGSIKRFTERNDTTEKFNQSQSGSNICERNRNTHLLKASPLLNSSIPNSFKTLPSSSNKMDEVNGIDMDFIFKKRGHSPETKRLWIERNHILKPDKTRIVGKGKESERIQ